MGVDISDLVSSEEITFDSLNGRTVGIDAMNTLYQFISIIRQRDGTPLMNSKGKVTSHLSGLFYRTTNLITFGIRPAYVFDGEPPKLKKGTLKARHKTRTDAKEKWEKAKKEGRIEDARKYAMASSRLDEEMIENSKKLLDSMGIPWVQAPGEGEAQLAKMAQEERIWVSASQDWDSLLFGAPRLLRNLTVSGRRKVPGRDEYIEVRPELIYLDQLFKQNNINQEQLILIGLLVGNDFEPGVKGIGPKRAFDLVQKYPTLKKLQESDIGPQIEEIGTLSEVEEIFRNPESTDNYNLAWDKPDIEGLRKILCDDNDFSEDRMMGTLKKLEQASKSTQSKLENFF